MIIYFGVGLHEFKEDELCFIDDFSVATIIPKWSYGKYVYKGVIDKYGSIIIPFDNFIENIENLGNGRFEIYYKNCDIKTEYNFYDNYNSLDEIRFFKK